MAFAPFTGSGQMMPFGGGFIGGGSEDFGLPFKPSPEMGARFNNIRKRLLPLGGSGFLGGIGAGGGGFAGTGTGFAGGGSGPAFAFSSPLIQELLGRQGPMRPRLVPGARAVLDPGLLGQVAGFAGAGGGLSPRAQRGIFQNLGNLPGGGFRRLQGFRR